MSDESEIEWPDELQCIECGAVVGDDGQRQVLSILPDSILHRGLKGENTPVEGEFRSGINDSGQLAIQEFN